MRIGENLNARSIYIGQDISGKLKVKASVPGGGSTAPGTPYMLFFDDYGWSATTITNLSTVSSRFRIGIAEGVVSSHAPTVVGKTTELFDFVIGGPTILQSTLATGTTGQSLKFTSAGIGATGAKFAGYSWEFAVYRNSWNPANAGPYGITGYNSSPLLSTADTQYGSISTGTQTILLTGEIISQQ